MTWKSDGNSYYEASDAAYHSFRFCKMNFGPNRKLHGYYFLYSDASCQHDKNGMECYRQYR